VRGHVRLSSSAHVHPVGLAAILTRVQELLTEASTADWPKRLRAVTPDLRREVLRDFNESDARMCKNIGVDQVLGAAAMAALWRRTFTAERDNRAGPDANAQRRGQISRQLKADLQEVINDCNDCEVPNIQRRNALPRPLPHTRQQVDAKTRLQAQDRC
jgi:hypothetical protein